MRKFVFIIAMLVSGFAASAAAAQTVQCPGRPAGEMCRVSPQQTPQPNYRPYNSRRPSVAAMVGGMIGSALYRQQHRPRPQYGRLPPPRVIYGDRSFGRGGYQSSIQNEQEGARVQTVRIEHPFNTPGQYRCAPGPNGGFIHIPPGQPGGWCRDHN